MQEYSTHTCIKWVPKTSNDVNYVYIFPDRGCYSMKGIIIHELMHAVGFFHEQSRTDRDDYITILWNNIQPGMQGQFEKYGQGTIQTLGVNYDYSSIMHYGSKAFSRNGQPTMVPKQKGAQIGQRGGFSKSDIYKLNKLYGCPQGLIRSTINHTLLICSHSCGSFKDGAKPESTTATATTTVTTPEIKTTTPAVVTTTPPPTTTTPVLTPITLPASVCRNLRGDCDALRDDGEFDRTYLVGLSSNLLRPSYNTFSSGWCMRNPGWMKAHCPISCGFCENKPSRAVFVVVTLRLTCYRYCRISESFMKKYCAKSCGFCFKPPPTDATKAGTALPIWTTNPPFITFWRTSTPTPSSKPTSLSTLEPSTSRTCKDVKHFCHHWKMAGFCEGIFMDYMKKNCAESCGTC
ncbi:unnamed protein product [Haemonchus placei]|uniref:Metalloendopeptidase n=1 Tax=Haemonchus placei TaxID=6290 RepID=A0A0N4X2Z1_HAEPC|nr:unnamed protein product [Haemonchus placei]